MTGLPRSASAAEEAMLASFQKELLPTLETYCFNCHGDGSDKGGVVLDDFKRTGKLPDHDLWMRVMRNIRAGAMPPADEDVLTPEEKTKILTWIKEQAFALDPLQPDPGRVTVRRLNRAEYRNTVQDLLGVDFDTDSEFPADDTGFGFDNIGSVLSVSPTLLEKLLDAAQKVVNDAVPSQPYVVSEQSLIGREFKFPDPTRPDPVPTAADFGVPPEFVAFLGEDVFDARYLSFYEAGRVQKIYKAEAAGTFDLTLGLQTAERFRSGERGPDKNRCIVRFKVNGKPLLEREIERLGRQTLTLDARAELVAGDNLLELTVEPVPGNEPPTRELRVRFNSLAMKGP
ncbi:MAG TPA: DUF1587 domain-containing protein, partial [Lacunisphaera sp.]|nr:DUF1587 domain-containing protein [Lacunisphaera sp.]